MFKNLISHNLTKKIINFIKRAIYLTLNILGIPYFTKKQLRIIKKLNYPVKSMSESIIFFTTHKCASNFSSEILKSIEHISEYNLYDYGALLGSLSNKLNLGHEFEPYLNKNYTHLFQPYGELYGPQRMPLSFPGIDDFKKIFFLRDPRDMLVSAYYSFGFSHVVPESELIKKNFLEKRKSITDDSIDNYVLKNSLDWAKPVYDHYELLKNSTKHSLFLKYNLYTDSTEDFLNKIFDFINIDGSSEIKRLIELANPIQNITQSNSHQRSGKNSQWKYELQEETQYKLTKILEHQLNYWGFEKNI